MLTKKNVVKYRVKVVNIFDTQYNYKVSENILKYSN